jgi:hypothetical protein
MTVDQPIRPWRSSSKALAGAAFPLWAALFVCGLYAFTGSKFIYTGFSVVSLLLLISGVRRPASYGYLFLAVFLWLGFWFKFTVHTVLDIPYGEPTGWFNKSPGAWNEVLLVSTAGLAGVLLAWGMVQALDRFRHCETTRTLTDIPPVCPAWFLRFRRPLWIVMFAGLFGLPLVNSVLGIMQIGLVPRTVLVWPLNAVIGWCVSIGLAIGVSTLVWWEMAAHKKAHIGPLLILGEAVLSTTTLLSRGVFLFHAVPTLLAFYRARPELVAGIRRKGMALLILLAFFGVSYLAVDLLRAYFYPDVRTTTTANQIRLTRLEVLQGAIAREEGNKRAGLLVDELLAQLYAEQARLQAPIKAARPEERIQVVPAPSASSASAVSAPGGAGAATPAELTTAIGEPVAAHIAPTTLAAAVANLQPAPAAPAVQAIPTEGDGLSGRLIDIGTRFLQLAVGRWIGLEGVMAVQAYPDKDIQTFVQAATEKRSQEGVTFYQKVSNSHYRWTDPNVWQFATLPGATAFLYYSGSIWLVVLGMAVLAGAVMLGERAVLLLTGNPLLCSLIGLSMANTVSQMGVTPRQDLPYYLMIGAAIGLIGVVQSGWMARLIGPASNKGYA